MSCSTKTEPKKGEDTGKYLELPASTFKTITVKLF